jgi:acyl-coenzyme A synthetase/AMP-(fatty) acid ligase/acyl carrier protein
MNLLEHLDDAFQQYAKCWAVEDDQTRLTYSELQAEVQKHVVILIHHQLVYGCMAIRKSHPIQELIQILAALYAGNHYFFIPNVEGLDVWKDVPIDAEWMGDQLIRCHDTPSPPVTTFNSNWYKQKDIGNKKMCVYATSATSGSPKYVLHQYHSIYADTLRQIEENQYNQLDKVDLLFSHSFSAALASIFPTLLTGACISCMRAEGGIGDIIPFWKKHAITVSTLTSSVFRALTQSTIPSEVRKGWKLRFVCISGERIEEEDVRRFFDFFPSGTTLQIAYATTETRTIACTLLTNADQYLPGTVGKIVMGKSVEILSDGYEQQDVGNIRVSSNDIALGYYQKRQVVPFPIVAGKKQYTTGDLGYCTTDDQLVITGRGDSLIKVDGKWVDIHHLEKYLKQKYQTNVLIISFIGKNGFDYLVAYIEKNDCIKNGNELANSLGEMGVVPKYYYELTRFPINNHGKIDQKQLRLIHTDQLQKQHSSESGHSKEATTRDTIREIWKTVLESNDVQDNSHFYHDLGGTSLLCMVMITEVEKKIHVKLKDFKATDLQTFEDFIDLITRKKILPRIDQLNQAIEGRKNLVFIENREGHSYTIMVNHFLDDYNVYMLRFDLYDSLLVTNGKETFKQLSDLINSNLNSYYCLIGNSFHGYIAAKIAEHTNKASQLILLDTPFYQNNQDSVLKNKTGKIWNFIASMRDQLIKMNNWKAFFSRIDGGLWRAHANEINDQSDFSRTIIQIIQRNENIHTIPNTLYLGFVKSYFTHKKDISDWEKITNGRFEAILEDIGHLDFNNPRYSGDIAQRIKNSLQKLNGANG